LEAGEPVRDFETWDRICKLYGWPQTVASSNRDSVRYLRQRIPSGMRERERESLA
jgi:hypothetical protein